MGSIFGSDGDGTADAGYGEELLSANWNPVIALLERSAARTAEAARRERPAIGEDDADAFLGRIYSAGA